LKSQRSARAVLEIEGSLLRGNTKNKRCHLKLNPRFEDINKALKLFTAIIELSGVSNLKIELAKENKINTYNHKFVKVKKATTRTT
jgi:hypothetical protein